MRQPTPFKDRNGDQVFTDDVLAHGDGDPGFYVIEPVGVPTAEEAFKMRYFGYKTRDWLSYLSAILGAESVERVAADVIIGTRQTPFDELIKKAKEA